jgi:hypothetical protein
MRKYWLAQKSVNWLVKGTLSFLLTEITRTAQNYIPHVQMHNSQPCDTILQIDWQV